MARVTFLRRFDYRPTRTTWITYQPGSYDNVRRECADQAIAAGAAVETSGRRGRFNGADEAKFDHDGKDGPGGSLKGALRRRKATDADA